MSLLRLWEEVFWIAGEFCYVAAETSGPFFLLRPERLTHRRLNPMVPVMLT